MSAWKKPSRSAWRRKACISRRASAGRSWPAARSASRSDSLMPSIHSRVSTSRAVSSHSTFGTRKPWSAAVASAISESAAASSRRSISIVTERASVSTTATGLQPARRRVEPLDEAGAGVERVEVAPEALADARPEHLDRDRPRRPSAPAISALCTCAIEAAATGGENAAKSSSTGLPSAFSIVGPRFGFGKRLDLVAEPAERRRPPRCRRCPAASRGTGRA